MTGGATAHELILVDYNQHAVRSFDLRTSRLDERDVYYRAKGDDDLCDVAYSAEWDTLLVASRNCSGESCWYTVRAFVSANASSKLSWSFQYRRRISNSTKRNSSRVYLRILRNYFLIGWSHRYSVFKCPIHLPTAKCVVWQLPSRHYGFEVQVVDNETRLAAVHANGTVALYRVFEPPKYPYEIDVIEDLGEFPLSNYYDDFWPLLMFGDKMLVGAAENGTFSSFKRISISAAGNFDIHRQSQSKLPNRVNIHSWCFAYGSLFAWDLISGGLLQFDYVN